MRDQTLPSVPANASANAVSQLPSDATHSNWLTAKEAAQHLKVKPRTILAWAKAGKIPSHPLSGSKRITWRFLRHELDAMLTGPSAAEFRRIQ